MREFIKNTVHFFSANKLVVQNYLALTFIQVVNVFFYIIIFPVVVPIIGVKSYGLFVYVSAILSFASILVSFGFDLPGLKVASSGASKTDKSLYFMSVLFLKVSLFVFVLLLLFLTVLIFSYIENKEVYYLGMLGVLGNTFIFSWYYQGKEKVTILAIIQSVFKLLSLFFIVFFVKGENDFFVFVLIMNLSILLSGFFSLAYLFLSGMAIFIFPRASDIRKVFIEGIPFFWASSIGAAKHRVVEVIIGTLFGVSEVALYDLANKIYSIPSILTTSINTTIFPKISKEANSDSIKRVFYYEFYLAVIIFFGIILLGYYIVDFLGEGLMGGAYIMLVLMGLNIFAFLIVGCYVYFVFLPGGKSDFVLSNQLLALLSFVIFLVVFLLAYWSVYSVILALVFSGFFEISYCRYLSRKIDWSIKL